MKLSTLSSTIRATLPSWQEYVVDLIKDSSDLKDFYVSCYDEELLKHAIAGEFYDNAKDNLIVTELVPPTNLSIIFDRLDYLTFLSHNHFYNFMSRYTKDFPSIYRSFIIYNILPSLPFNIYGKSKIFMPIPDNPQYITIFTRVIKRFLEIANTYLDRKVRFGDEEIEVTCLFYTPEQLAAFEESFDIGNTSINFVLYKDVTSAINVSHYWYFDEYPSLPYHEELNRADIKTVCLSALKRTENSATFHTKEILTEIYAYTPNNKLHAI